MHAHTRMHGLAVCLFAAASFPIAANADSPITQLQQQVQSIQTQVNDLSAQTSDLNTRLGNLATTISDVGTRLSAVEGEFDPAAITVNCGAGESLAAALNAPGAPLTITVVGTCNENISINRDDVTLLAGAGGEVHGPNAQVNTIAVFSHRVTIDGLKVSGGNTAVSLAGAGRFILRNCTIGPAGRTGVALVQGAQGLIDHCTIQNNPGDGVFLDSSTSTILNSDISANGRTGLFISNGSTARVGAPVTGGSFGNTINNNAGTGIHITLSSNAVIGGNTVNGNGTSATGFGSTGINLFHSTADIAFGNTISGNAGHGVQLIASSAFFSDPGFNVNTPNVISNNGVRVGGSSGVNLTLGSLATINPSTQIQNNTGNGLTLSLRSTAQVFTSITGNTGNAISLSTGSAATGGGTLSGNASPAIVCIGADARVQGFSPSDLDPACISF